MHVLVIMFTLFMLGYMGSKMCFGSDELWVSFLLDYQTNLLIWRSSWEKQRRTTPAST